ncbi:cytochrome c [Halobacillus shinanisalinarum]|uniref:Cytochrome c n=1 Tax=Halobacillus shinanisalinarum TaxID=2932258 RepID=A0ABY4H478_9BACI|nr:cytochrome c [Halobacillus shinanisalinarum]UOQ94382.1 cytochrome c [Halobacillus shinanisalinarum]
MNKKLLTALFGTALVLGACGGGGGDEGTDTGGGDNGGGSTSQEQAGGDVDTQAAEQAYEQSCASCHGGDLTGAVGPNLTQVGSKYSADEIADIIKNGKGQMPAQGGNVENVENLANWLAAKK